MPLITQNIPNLVSGVSQQPAPTRLTSSCEEIDNGFPSVVQGMTKRPPSELISELNLNFTVGDTTAIHMIDRSVDLKYILLGGSGDLALYDQYGVEQTITFPDGKGYLPATDMWKKLKFATVADTTFVLNTEKTAASVALSEARQNPYTRSSVFIRTAVAGVTYNVYADGTLVASYTTSDNTSAATKLQGTTEIAARLRNDAISRGVAAYNRGPVLGFPSASGAIIQVDDQFGGNAMTYYGADIDTFEDLPPSEIEGRLVRVLGGPDAPDDGYWVEYRQGLWTETVGYGSQRSFDAATLPHILVKTGPSTFEFRQNDWASRLAGDINNNPDPSFIGSTINNLFIFKGRLGLLTGENVVMSEVTNFENFYRTTAVQLLVSDPIDVASATGRVSTLYHAASFSNELLLFSDRAQFRLASGDILSADTVGITSSTAYPCSVEVSPVVAGGSAYFLGQGATHSTAREVFMDGDRSVVQGEDISVQTPRYIPNSLRTLTASPEADIMVALTEDEPNTLYVYKWYTSNRRKLQSAWFRWVFPEGTHIIGTGFLGADLYLVYKATSGVYMDRLTVTDKTEVELLLDHQFDETHLVSRVYDNNTNVTTVVVPVAHADTFDFHELDGDTYFPIQSVGGVTKVNDTTYEIGGDVTSSSLIAGLNYELRVELSQQYLRRQRQDGTEVSVQDGRLQLSRFSVLYTDTSYFEAHVTRDGYDTEISVFNGRIFGNAENITNTIPTPTGEFSFPVKANSGEVKIELVSNQPYPCSFSSVEWTAQYNPRARRL